MDQEQLKQLFLKTFFQHSKHPLCIRYDISYDEGTIRSCINKNAVQERFNDTTAKQICNETQDSDKSKVKWMIKIWNKIIPESRIIQKFVEEGFIERVYKTKIGKGRKHEKIPVLQVNTNFKDLSMRNDDILLQLVLRVKAFIRKDLNTSKNLALSDTQVRAMLKFFSRHNNEARVLITRALSLYNISCHYSDYVEEARVIVDKNSRKVCEIYSEMSELLSQKTQSREAKDASMKAGLAYLSIILKAYLTKNLGDKFAQDEACITLACDKDVPHKLFYTSNAKHDGRDKNNTDRQNVLNQFAITISDIVYKKQLFQVADKLGIPQDVSDIGTEKAFFCFIDAFSEVFITPTKFGKTQFFEPKFSHNRQKISIQALSPPASKGVVHCEMAMIYHIGLLPGSHNTLGVNPNNFIMGIEKPCCPRCSGVFCGLKLHDRFALGSHSINIGTTFNYGKDPQLGDTMEIKNIESKRKWCLPSGTFVDERILGQKAFQSLKEYVDSRVDRSEDPRTPTEYTNTEDLLKHLSHEIINLEPAPLE
ncbi:hypothetical protein [Candidatus Sneabacter namystus]|uniref:Uncharacterized protein n=1 Tax=Candidatus Sneabacter namystus TaxID=2601646 RepID=A0A5C0UJJ9_9RICK|nr:hypothetical protein [Candidatus Sneabacter namystus]QEK39652.1 hypothetical protein FZC37_01750 [Candidatus Sneabacter namystus]